VEKKKKNIQQSKPGHFTLNEIASKRADNISVSLGSSSLSSYPKLLGVPILSGVVSLKIYMGLEKP